MQQFLKEYEKSRIRLWKKKYSVWFINHLSVSLLLVCITKNKEEQTNLAISWQKKRKIYDFSIATHCMQHVRAAATAKKVKINLQRTQDSFHNSICKLWQAVFVQYHHAVPANQTDFSFTDFGCSFLFFNTCLPYILASNF